MRGRSWRASVFGKILVRIARNLSIQAAIVPLEILSSIYRKYELIDEIFNLIKNILEEGNLLYSYSLTFSCKLHQEINRFSGYQKEEKRCYWLVDGI